MERQLRDLIDLRAPAKTLTEDEIAGRIGAELAGHDRRKYGRWVYYPWSGRIIHLLPPDAFREVRLDRNRNR